jgi:hypothetical protein
VELSEGAASELNNEHFFQVLLGAVAEDCVGAFKLEASYLLAVAFLKLATTEVDDFLVREFVDVLETIELGFVFDDGRQLTAEMERVAHRLHRLLPEDSELREALCDVVPERILTALEMK